MSLNNVALTVLGVVGVSGRLSTYVAPGRAPAERDVEEIRRELDQELRFLDETRRSTRRPH